MTFLYRSRLSDHQGCGVPSRSPDFGLESPLSEVILKYTISMCHSKSWSRSLTLGLE